MFDGDDALVRISLKDRHTLGVAASNADVIDGAADQLAAVGHQHDLIGFSHGERRHQRTVALIDNHGNDAFAAPSRSSVLVRRGPLTIALLRNSQHELFFRAKLREALRRQLGRTTTVLLCCHVGFAIPHLFALRAAKHRCLLQIRRALWRLRIHVREDRH